MINDLKHVRKVVSLQSALGKLVTLFDEVNNQRTLVKCFTLMGRVIMNEIIHKRSKGTQAL